MTDDEFIRMSNEIAENAAKKMQTRQNMYDEFAEELFLEYSSLKKAGFRDREAFSIMLFMLQNGGKKKGD